MTGTAINYRMPSGFPGNISRTANAKVEAWGSDAAKPFTAYGLVGMLSAGKFVPATEDAAYGLLVRPYPTQSAVVTNQSLPAADGVIHDVLKSGYMTVKCNAGTPAVNGTVYFRIDNAAEGQPIGGIEAASTADTVALLGAIFLSTADENGNVEIAYNI